MIRAVLLTRSNLKNYQSKHQGPKLLDTIERYIPERLKPLWHHEAGLQTVFFWAPLFKWGLVFAGLADLSRDPATLSESQTFSLLVTGLIWSRYSIVIVPKNYLLLSVNMFVSLVQTIQMYRILTYTPVVTNK